MLLGNLGIIPGLWPAPVFLKKSFSHGQSPQHPKVIFPVHLHTLVEAGVYLVENMMLSQLAREGVTAFCLILLPVKFKGATGCPVRPVAMI